MGNIADKYRARSRRMSAEQIKMRLQVRRLLRNGLKDATQKQLYDRTTLKVTKKMMNSITTQSDSKSISVGYNLKTAPYVRIRLAKTGKSKLGGHEMTMTPAQFIEVVYGDKIFAIARGSLKRIHGD